MNLHLGILDATGKRAGADSQDCWVFNGLVRVVEADFLLGIPGADNRLARLIKDAGYEIINPSKTMRCLHLHATRVRNYARQRIRGPYLFVKPQEL